MSAGGAGAGAAIIAMQTGAKVFGALVKVEPEDFMQILARTEKPLIVAGTAGVFTTKYRYLTPYKQFIFYCVTRMPLELPHDAEFVNAKTILVPGL